MSDYDEYGDAFDCLWIDFDEPHFTDEMTMMVNPDPVFLDDSSLEDAFETDTDWEYFSDEYYDHDKPDKVRRQKKKIENKKPAQLDSATFYGVSWSAGPPSNNDGPLYQPGEGEKVSLLKNWREVFQESKPKTKKTSEKLKQDGNIRATFHDHLSTRFRRNSEQGALVDDNLNLNNNMEIDGLSRPVSGLKTFLLGSNMRAEKKGRDHLSMNNNGPQLRKGSSAREEAKPNNKLDIILPPAPENIEEYKDIITTAPPVTQKRGRKRKADVTVEQTTSGLDSSLGSGPIRSSKRKKAGHTNGVKTAASSRPTRSSTRRK
ncbi:hypothetical protein GTR04_6407 [Trichophyton interdigitale]|nr:hypothetical protein GY631_6314 [Trichophyton interdigitale]KAG5217583.1 hypothetical protein GY632_6409 [Trichophyton interdigitale]KAG8206210.1 hypothetical protein GTR04_6407 [Trichophyton interdigitale]